MEDDSFRIRSGSKDLAVEVIRTLPVDPVYANFSSSVRALGVYNLSSPEGIEDYLAECERERVLPRTFVQFDYDPARELFVYKPKTSGFISQLSPELSPEYTSRLNRAVQRPGRFSSINYNIDVSDAACGFRMFRDEILPGLLDDGYFVMMGRIWLTYTHSSGYDEGYRMDSGINLIGGAHLDISESQSGADKIIPWFTQLKRKYEEGDGGI